MDMAAKEIQTSSSLDDSIIVEESDSPVITRKLTRSRNPSRTAMGKDCARICEYPVGQSDTVTVSTQDYATLQHDTFLNDIIVDFYLTYLAYNVLPAESRESVHIFSTMFYKRLLQSPTKNAKKVANYETDPMLTSVEKRHFRVAGWTKNVNLFAKDVLIVPICEHSHWYLVVVIKPGSISNPVKSEERILKGEPFVIVLDSIGGSKNTAVTNIRHYLASEWRKKKCSGEYPSEEFAFSSTEMRIIRPRKPEQENGSDCGIYLLHYVEKIFHSLKQFLWPNLPNLSDWFTMEEVGEKREKIAELIRVLANEQRPGETINFPNIKFAAEKMPRKSRKPVERHLNEKMRLIGDDGNAHLLQVQVKCRGLRASRPSSSSKDVATRSCNSTKDNARCSNSAKDVRTGSPNSAKYVSMGSSNPPKDVATGSSYTPNNFATGSSNSSQEVETNSSNSSKDVATSSPNDSDIATRSKSNFSKDIATGSSTKFSEEWNEWKEKVIEGRISFDPVTKKTDEKLKKRRRHGLEAFKGLQVT